MTTQAPHLFASTLAAALIATTLSAPAWAQQAEPTERQGLEQRALNTADAPEASDDPTLGGLYDTPADGNQQDTQDQRPLPSDLRPLPIGVDFPVDHQVSQFNFRAEKPGMMTLFVAGMGNTPSMRIQTRDGMDIPGGNLDEQTLNQLRQFQQQMQPGNFNGRVVGGGFNGGFGGAWGTNAGIVANGSSVWLLVHIPQAGDYTVSLAAADAQGVIAPPQAAQRWAIPIDEFERAQQQAQARPTETQEDARPTPYASVQWIELLSPEEQQAEIAIAQQREEQEQQRRIQNAQALVHGQAIDIQPNDWVRYTAPASGILIVTGQARGNLRFEIHSPDDLESYLEYIDENRGNDAGSEAIIYPLTANQTVLILANCSRSSGESVRLRTHFEPDVPLPAENR